MHWSIGGRWLFGGLLWWNGLSLALGSVLVGSGIASTSGSAGSLVLILGSRKKIGNPIVWIHTVFWSLTYSITIFLQYYFKKFTKKSYFFMIFKRFFVSVYFAIYEKCYVFLVSSFWFLTIVWWFCNLIFFCKNWRKTTLKPLNTHGFQCKNIGAIFKKTYVHLKMHILYTHDIHNT